MPRNVIVQFKIAQMAVSHIKLALKVISHNVNGVGVRLEDQGEHACE